MSRRFVIEAVMIAIYGQLLLPKRPVEYRIPYTSVMELYDMKDSPDPVMPESEDDAYVKSKIGEMISYFEDPFNKKKIERALMAPWRESPPLPINENVSLVIVNAARTCSMESYSIRSKRKSFYDDSFAMSGIDGSNRVSRQGCPE